MMKVPVYYRNRTTGKIEAKFVGCDTRSVKYRDEKLYERFVSEKDLPLEVTPEPAQRRSPPELCLESPDRTVWTITIDNAGKIRISRK